MCRLSLSVRSSSVLLCLVLLPAAARAAPAWDLGDGWRLEPGAQLRLRGVVDTGRDLLDDPALGREYVTQRARLQLALVRDEGPRVFLQIQDVRLWGEEANTLNDASADGLDLHQAYVDLPVGDVRLRLGRQELNLDDQRLVGAVGWTQRARSFDGVRLTWTAGKTETDAFFMLVQEKDRDPDGAVPEGRVGDVTFGGLHTLWKPSQDLRIAASLLSRADVPKRHYRHTAGGIVGGRLGGFALGGQLYYQLGSLEDRPVSALLAAVSAARTFEVAGRPGLRLWGEYLSGDGTKEGTFDTLFATNHKFYGEMDFFLNIPVHTGGRGLVDLGGRLSAQPMEEVGVRVDVHHLRAATPFPGGAVLFGNEVDFGLKVEVMEGVRIDAVYAFLRPGGALARARGLAGEPTLEHFAYLTLDARF